MWLLIGEEMQKRTYVEKQVSLDKHSLYSDLLCFEMKHYMVLL